MTDPYLSLDTSSTSFPATPLSLDVVGAPIPLPSDVVASRAAKAEQGLQQVLNKSYDDYFQEFTLGKEPQIRQQAAATQDNNFARQQASLVQQIASTRPEMLSEAVRTMKFNQQTDPDTVIEKNYATEFMKYFSPDLNNPDASRMDDTIARASEIVATREYINKKLEEVEAKKNALGLWGTIKEKAEYLTPGLGTIWKEIAHRVEAPLGVFFLEHLNPAEQAESQRQAMMNLPFDERKAYIDKATDHLTATNLDFAIDYLKLMKGQTTSEAVLNTALPLIDVGVYPVSAAMKIPSMARGIIEHNMFMSQLRDMTKASEQLGSTTARVIGPSAAGDLPTAATRQLGDAAIATAKGDAKIAETEARAALSSGMNADMVERSKSPGRWGQEIINRINERTAGFRDNLFEALTTAMKVERIPEGALAEQVMKQYYEGIKDEFKGIRNSILDFSAPYRNRLTSNWNYDIIFGNTKGEYFATYNNAKAWAEMQRFEDAYVISSQGSGTKFHVKLTRNLNETDPVIRGAIAKLAETKTPDSLLSSFQWINSKRTPEETLALANRLNRKVAIYVASKYGKLFKDEAQAIKDLARGKPSTELGHVGLPTLLRGKPKTDTFGAKVQTYTTSDGSTYTVTPPISSGVSSSGTNVKTTIRNPQVAGEETRPRSDLTVYVDPSEVKGITTTKANKRFTVNENSISLAEPVPGEGFGIKGGASVTHEPALGKVPVQLFSPSTLNGIPAFRDIHIGSPIAEMTHQRTGSALLSPAQRYEEWRSMVENGREIIDPVTQKKGYFYKNTAELDEAYIRLHGRLPSEQETVAYFRFTDLNEMDRIMRNLVQYKYQARLGADHWSVFNFAGEAGAKVESPKFVGMQQKVFPHTEDGIVFIGGKGEKTKIFRNGTFDMSTAAKREFEKDVQEGKLQVIRIYAPEHYPLAGFLDDNARIRYVVTNNTVRGELPFDQIPRRGGGHVEYDYDHYIKQAKIVPQYIKRGPDGVPIFKHGYEGDTTLMPISNRVMGQDVINKMNPIIKMMDKKDWVAAEAMFNSSELPMDWKEFSGWFKPSYAIVDGKKTKIAPRLSTSEDLHLVSKDKMIIEHDASLEEKYKGTFHDYTRSGSDSRQFQLQFTGERDAHEVFTINNAGTRHNPLYSYEPANKVDAITSLNRATQRIASSTLLDDYKVSSIEHWLQEAGRYLRVEPSEVSSAPFWVFQKAEWRRDAPPDIVAKLEVSRLQIKELTGQSSALGASLHSLEQRLADTVYGLPTDEFFTRSSLLAAHWAIANTDNASKFIRSMTFNLTMGLFSPVQMVVQGMTWVNIAAMAPRSVMQGTSAHLLHTWDRMNSSHIATLDRAATYLGWKPGQFTEARDLLKRTGFDMVGGEHVTSQDAFNPKVITSGFQDMLSSGQTIWREGERNVRIAAWYTAMHEFRRLNPTKVIDNFELQRIFDRAETMSGNMSTASKSMVQKGFMEWPSQFLGYQLRTMELMTGKRLDTLSKARVIGAQALMYGIPAAAGIALGPASFFPFGDYMKKAAYEHGYTPGDNFISTAFNEGLIAAMTGVVTGHTPNIGSRYGNPGIDFIREAVVGQKSWWNLIGGASLSTATSFIDSMDGLYRVMGSLLKDGGTTFPLTPDDLILPLTQAASFNQGRRLLLALQTQQWTNRKGIELEKIAPLRAVIQTLTGLQSTELSDIRYKTWTIGDRDENNKWVTKQYIEHYTIALQALRNNDPQEANANFKKATAFLAYAPTEKVKSIVALGADTNKNLISRIDFSYYMRNVPPGKLKDSLETYGKVLNLERQRGQ